MLNDVSSTLHLIGITWLYSPTQTDAVRIPDFSYLFLSCIHICPRGEKAGEGIQIILGGASLNCFPMDGRERKGTHYRRSYGKSE